MGARYKGKLQACLDHLYALLKDRDDYHAERKKIADFCEVSEQAVYRWFKKSATPHGEPLLRLKHYLELNGYEVHELLSLSPVVRDLGRLCAFRIIGLAEIAALAGYTEQEGVHTMQSILRGTRGYHESRAKKFLEVIEVYSEQLQGKQRAVPLLALDVDTEAHESQPARKLSVVGQPPQAPVQKRVSVPSPLAEVADGISPATRDAVIKALADGMRGLLPLADMVSSDSFTEEERARVRELAGGNSVFLLANRIYRLCGERSRSMHPVAK